MKRFRNWLLAAICVAPVLGWVYAEYVRPAWSQATCPGTNCTFNTSIGLPVENMIRRTFSAAAANVVPFSTPSDIAQICGNASTTVRLMEIRVSGLASTALNTPITLVRRYLAEAQPGSLNVTPMVHDTSYVSANTVPITFPTAPTTITNAMGSIRNDIIFLGNATTTASMVPIIWRFGDHPANSVVLRGVNQCVTINLNNSTNNTVVTGTTLQISWEWSEDGS